ncbi:unnamed protein product [Brachionus calyciflorus]|uniref:Uncharacterized protein n=1 Tax=Brachionus calyciflorus TaxID=104777 RepID=A0A814EEN6_9BILA|nr:unnamed protein product [Brachionus calyciflorus]
MSQSNILLNCIVFGDLVNKWFIFCDYSKHKKVYEELKCKNKVLSKNLDETESNYKQIQDLEEKLKEKKKLIDELSEKLEKKNQEFENLNHNFLSNQEEMRLFKIKLKNFEEIIKEQNDQINIHEKVTSSNQVIPKLPISSLLITPTIRKSIGQSYIESLDSNIPPNETISNCFLGDEHNRAKESLEKSFQDKLMSLERSKIQTKNILESLKLNLNDIELLTANNIYKITSITS